MKQNKGNLQTVRNHGSVVLSVMLWGLTQFLVDRLLVYFSPELLIFLRFLTSGILLVVIFRQEKVKFRLIYLLTGGLGAFGYYILIEYALKMTSVPFVAIMGGVLPTIAIFFDWWIEKRWPLRMQVLAAALTIVGLSLFSFQATFKWNITGILLMIVANVSWVLYLHLKKRVGVQNEMKILGYEFIGAGVLTLPFGISFHLLKPVNAVVLVELVVIIVFATIIPYVLYLKGSRELSVSTSSLYLNFLPVASLIPSFLMGRLALNPIQLVGLCILVLSCFGGILRGNRPVR